MKKALVIILALALVMGLSAPALAAEERQTELHFYYDAPDPLYYVTISDSLVMHFGDNYLDISVEGTENLGSKKVTITFEETQDISYIIDLEDGPHQLYNNSLWPNGVYNYDMYTVYYEIYDYLGNINDLFFNRHRSLPGTVLAEFTGDGDCSLRLVIDENFNVQFHPNTPYVGYITFGISLR